MSAAVPSLSAQFLKDLQAIVGADGMIAGEQDSTFAVTKQHQTHYISNA